MPATLTKPRPTAQDREKARAILLDSVGVLITAAQLDRPAGYVADLRDRIAEALAEERAAR